MNQSNININTQEGELTNESGQLAVDVYNLEEKIIVIAPIAGVNETNIEITVNEEILVIKGHRYIPTQVQEATPFTSECFWGGFSRAIVLPEHTEIDKIAATFEENLLVITIPKNQQPQSRVIKIKP